jgi:hypothetical protein
VSSPSESSPPRRQTALAVVMFGVLAAAVLAAWVLSHIRGRWVHNAEDLLAKVRGRGLGAYWPAQTVRWYLQRRGGKVIGWQLLLRAQRPDGSFEGAWAHVGPPTGSGSRWSHWVLAQDASAGDYYSETGDFLRGPQWRWIPDGQTSVKLENGRLKIEQGVRNRAVESEARPPSNYLPEGTLPLARQLVAAERTKASFQITLDGVPPEGGVPRFFTVRLRRSDAPPVAGAAAVVSEQMRREQSEYHLDDQGVPVRIRIGQTIVEAAGQDAVLDEFADARVRLWLLLGSRRGARALAVQLLGAEFFGDGARRGPVGRRAGPVAGRLQRRLR